MSTIPILPGATLGVLGSGQLGRMFTQAAVRMGYHVRTYAPDAAVSPCAQAGAEPVVGAYDDLDTVAAFAQSVSAVTFEFENVSAHATEIAAQYAPVRPGGDVLHTTQHRLREKNFLARHGFPTTNFVAVARAEDMPGDEAFHYPAILKTAGFGYDGKGQQKVASRDEAIAAFNRLGGQECILEALVDFTVEVAIVAARGVDGSFAAYPPVRNDHANHILDLTTAPAPNDTLTLEQAREATAIARGVLEGLNVVGVMAVEMFVTTGGKLLINELAPRPHNSGHWTIEACPASQFEQQVRAVCSLPLGDTTPLRPAAMVNLLGDVWQNGTPDFASALALPNVHLHLYGKPDARPGRKMGHITALADTAQEAATLAKHARAVLTG